MKQGAESGREGEEEQFRREGEEEWIGRKEGEGVAKTEPSAIFEKFVFLSNFLQ